ncbi:hypothetical protein PWT90_06866 [Aphanocladium album]|nr:hypothetical protein PWT90_06866 [Aphanocladium album]
MSDRIEPNAATPASTEPDRHDISECLKLLPKPTPVSIRKPGRCNYPTTWKDNKVPDLLVGSLKDQWDAQIEKYLEAGWMAKYAPEPPFGFNFNYTDRRKRFPGLCDTFTTDNPSADSHRFLELGQEIARSNIWSKGKWKPGDLIGPGGGDPATKAESASQVPHERWEEWQAGKDKRPITSIAHLHHHQRPAEAGVGWGGFDHLNRWQSYGRCVRLHMTADQEFQRSPLAPMLFHDEKGEPANTVDAVFDPARYGRPSPSKH